MLIKKIQVIAKVKRDASAKKYFSEAPISFCFRRSGTKFSARNRTTHEVSMSFKGILIEYFFAGAVLLFEKLMLPELMKSK